MKKLAVNANIFAIATICGVLGAVSPTASFAGALNNLWCKSQRRACNADCNHGSQSQACYDQCLSNYQACFSAGSTTKQQTPPPPCNGPLCNIRGANPPRTVSPPNLKPSPTRPVKPVGVSNPNQTTPGNAPVILERRGGSEGGRGLKR